MASTTCEAELLFQPTEHFAESRKEFGDSKLNSGLESIMESIIGHRGKSARIIRQCVGGFVSPTHANQYLLCCRGHFSSPVTGGVGVGHIIGAERRPCDTLNARWNPRPSPCRSVRCHSFVPLPFSSLAPSFRVAISKFERGRPLCDVAPTTPEADLFIARWKRLVFLCLAYPQYSLFLCPLFSFGRTMNVIAWHYTSQHIAP